MRAVQGDRAALRGAGEAALGGGRAGLRQGGRGPRTGRRARFRRLRYAHFHVLQGRPPGRR